MCKNWWNEGTTEYGIMSRRFRELLHRLAFRDYINAFIENYNGFATSNCNTVEAWDKQAVYKRRGLRGNSSCNAPFRTEVNFYKRVFLSTKVRKATQKRPNISDTPTPRRLPSPQPARSLNQPTSSSKGLLTWHFIFLLQSFKLLVVLP